MFSAPYLHPTTPTRAKVVLLIEDEPGDVELIRLQIEDEQDDSYQLHHADSMAQARQLVEAEGFRPDVVVLDLNLPDSAGVATVTLCRSLINAPVIVLTGLDNQDARQATIQSGAEDYLIKGGSALELHKALRYAMLRYARDTDARLATAVFMHSYDGIMITDAQGVIIEVNPALCRITGYQAAELLGNSPRRLASGKHNQQFYAAMWRDILAKDVWQGELVNRHRDGHLYFVGESITVCRNATGRIQQFICVMRDITERHAAQTALQRSNNRLQSILDNIPVGLSVFDADLKLVAMNTLFQTNLDLPDSLLDDNTSFDSILRFNVERGEYGTAPSDDQIAEKVARVQPLRAHQFERTRPNGVVLDIRGAPMPDGGFVTTYADITERKQAQAQATHSMQLLRAAMDSIDEAFALFDPQDRLTFFNDKFRQIYATSSEVIQLGISFETLIREGVRRGQHPDAVGRVEEWVAQRLAAHRAADAPILQHLDDGRVLRIIERRLPDGSTAGFRIDITDLVRANEEAQAANLAKSRFLATMSHEIRTPMNGILGMAQLLIQPNLSERDRLEYAQTVLGSGQSLLSLLNDILDLSKIEAGHFEIDLSTVVPAHLLQETHSLFSGAAKNKGLQLDWQWLGAPGHSYQSDSHRLRQMLANLVGNAIKFTPTGRILIEAAEIRRNDSSATLEFSVTDSGIGIAPEKQTALFEAFSQADSSTTREFGGSGLGLSIVSRLAQLLGGSVGVHSALGQGARFWFQVQVNQMAQTGASASPAVAPALVQPDSGPQHFTGRVLVAEDNPVNCMVIEGLLGTLGLEVELVDNGQQAVNALAQANALDLVLMDLHMPVMDGYQATQQIRQAELASGRKRVPIMALTADAFEDDRLHCLDVGMDDFLTKPIALDALRQALTRWLKPAKPPAATAQQPGADDASGVAARPHPTLAALLAETSSLLAQHKFDAIDRFETLQAAAAHTRLAAALSGIAPLVKSLRFAEALALLQQLSDAP